MTTTTYTIIFDGRIAEGRDAQEVKQNLATFFKADENKMAVLFSGKKIIIRKNTDKKTALKYKQAFENAGAVCVIRKEPGTPESPQPQPKPREPYPSIPQPVNTMECPSCGHQQPQSNECARCGIIFSKFQARPSYEKSYVSAYDPGASSVSPKSSSRSKSLAILLPLIAVVLLFVYLFRGTIPGIFDKEITYGPGQVAPNTPEQETTDAVSFDFKGFKIKPLARYQVEARVLSKKKYTSDRDAKLSLYDLALGWGPMSDELVLNEIKITQSGRFYHWKTERLPIPKKQIIQNSANTHMIHADALVLEQLKKVQKGHVVVFSGYLVEVSQESERGKMRWRSSLKRTDTGAGACEVVFVEELIIK